MPIPALEPEQLALFLDLDGTLAELSSEPGKTRVGAEVIATLRALDARLRGALAIVSGRPIAEVDRVLQPLRLNVVGLHGLQWRDPAARDDAGEHAGLGGFVERLEPARAVIGRAVAGRPRLRLEDKGATLAVHFREAPAEAPFVAQLVEDLVAGLGPEFESLDGVFVKEIRPRSCNKGTAVSRLMRLAQFAGRTPVYVGDDFTDLDAFRVVEALGGHTIAVGERIEGRHRLAGPAEVARWLSELYRT